MGFKLKEERGGVRKEYELLTVVRHNLVNFKFDDFQLVNPPFKFVLSICDST